MQVWQKPLIYSNPYAENSTFWDFFFNNSWLISRQNGTPANGMHLFSICASIHTVTNSIKRFTNTQGHFFRLFNQIFIDNKWNCKFIILYSETDTDDEDIDEEDDDVMVADEAVDDDYDDEDIDESEQEDEETWNNLRYCPKQNFSPIQ